MNGIYHYLPTFKNFFGSVKVIKIKLEGVVKAFKVGVHAAILWVEDHLKRL